MAAYTTIDDPGLFFTAFLYSGDASTSPKSFNAKTGVGFQPDMTWHKSRTSTGWHGVVDSVRGADADPGCVAFYPNATNAEQSNTDEYLDGYQSDGFKTGENGSFGAPSQNYVAWCWKMGTTSGISGTGNLTVNGYSFNSTAKQSVIDYTGNGGSSGTYTHGLGSAPGFIFGKNRDEAGDGWFVYHHKNTASPETDYLVLNTTAATVARV